MLCDLETLTAEVQKLLMKRVDPNDVQIDALYCGNRRVILTAYLKSWRVGSRTPHDAYTTSTTCEEWGGGKFHADHIGISEHILAAKKDRD